MVSIWAMVVMIVSMEAIVRAAIMVVIVIAVMIAVVVMIVTVVRNIDIVVPGVLHEVDTLAARIVLMAISAPISCVARRYVKIYRLAFNNRRPFFNDDWLPVYHLRRRLAAEIDAAKEARLPHADRDANVCSDDRTCKCNERRCK